MTLYFGFGELSTKNLTRNMASTNDYTTMTLDELTSEEKKLKSYLNPAALFIGFLVGIAVFAAVKGKLWLVVMVMVWVFILAARSNEALKNVQAELKSRQALD